MDEDQRYLVDRHLPSLIKDTKSSEYFLAILLSKGVLDEADLDIINAEKTGHGRNSTLYSILKTRIDAFKHLRQALTETKQSGVVSILDMDINCARDSENLSTSPRPVRYHVWPPSQLFTGRDEYMKQIETIFNIGNTAIVCQSIVGLGGVGKTELARKIVENLIKQERGYALNVIWLNAETEQDLMGDFTTLVKDEKQLRIDIKDSAGGNKDISTIVKEVYAFFDNKPCLFVFDNAENEGYLSRFIPNSYFATYNGFSTKKPMVLITSRDNDWLLTTECSLVTLQVFSETDAIHFVQKGLKLTPYNTKLSNQKQFIVNLVNRLEYLPLAIKQAVHYIAEQMKADENYGARDYVEDWGCNSKNLLSRNIRTENKTTYTTWKTTIVKISRDETCGNIAIMLLNLIAFMAPNDIALNLFKNHTLKSYQVREAFALLQRYSMVSSNGSKFSVHRLVQEVTRIDMRLKNTEEQTVEEVLKLFGNNLNDKTVSHVQSAWEHAKEYKKVVMNYLSLPYLIMLSLAEVKNYHVAYDFAKQELELLQRVLPDKNDVLILRLQAHYCKLMDWCGKGCGFDMLWSRLQKALNDSKLTNLEAAMLLSDVCRADRNKAKYPDAWIAYENIMDSLGEAHCSTGCVQQFYTYGLLKYDLLEFPTAIKVFKNALSAMSNEENVNQAFQQRIRLHIELAKWYLDSIDTHPDYSRDLLHELGKMLESGNDDNIFWIFRVSWTLFYKFGDTDEALSICQYYLTLEADLNGISVDVPNALNQISIIMSESGDFKNALKYSIQANEMIQDMHYDYKKFDEIEFKIHLARAMAGVARVTEAVAIARQVLPDLLVHVRKDIDIFSLAYMNIVAADVFALGHEADIAVTLVEKADSFLSSAPKNLSMPFLKNKLMSLAKTLECYCVVEIL